MARQTHLLSLVSFCLVYYSCLFFLPRLAIPLSVIDSVFDLFPSLYCFVSFLSCFLTCLNFVVYFSTLSLSLWLPSVLVFLFFSCFFLYMAFYCVLLLLASILSYTIPPFLYIISSLHHPVCFPQSWPLLHTCVSSFSFSPSFLLFHLHI